MHTKSVVTVREKSTKSEHEGGSAPVCGRLGTSES
eukprot:COSAG03_NODE_35684_length_116_cov_39.294118_1_plen_34_part_10